MVLTATRSLRSDRSGVSAVVAVVLLVAITAVLAALFFLIAGRSIQQPHDAVESDAQAKFASGIYEVTALGPDNLQLSEGRLLVDLNGAMQELPLEALAPQLEDGAVWHNGETVCIVGPAPCLYPGAVSVGISVVVGDDVVFAMAPLKSTYPVQISYFEILEGGGIRLLEVANIRTDVVGTSLNYGAGGPVVPVTSSLTTDGGNTFISMFGGLPVGIGSTTTLTGTVPGSILGVQGHAQYLTLFSATYDSVSGSAHVWTLQDGDDAPDVAPFLGQQPLKSYLEPYIDPETNTVTLADNQVILLFEFNPTLTGSAADFQDLVVLFTFV